MTVSRHYAALLLQEEHLLITSSSESNLDELMSMAIQSQGETGIIGDEFPLISNLDILENITLGIMYSRNISLEYARAMILPSIKALQMETIMHRSKAMLSKEEIIRSQILRCIASGNSIMLLPSPTPRAADSALHAAARVPSRPRIWISCHTKKASAYEYLHLSPYSMDG